MQWIRNTADEFFEQQGLKLPLKLDRLKKTVRDIGWEIYAYSEASDFIDYLQMLGHTGITDNDGFTYKQANSNEPVKILYKDELPTMRKISVICHEIGHNVLGHTAYNGILGKNESREVQNALEKEAEEFALEFQAPIPILRKMDLNSVDAMVREGVLPPCGARKQKLYMCRQNLVKRRHLIIAVSFALLLCGSIIWNFVTCSGDTPPNTRVTETKRVTETETETVYSGNTTGDEKKTKTVYVTHSGRKYHRLDCRYIKYNNSVTELTCEEAEESGYTACSICKPDRD